MFGDPYHLHGFDTPAEARANPMNLGPPDDVQLVDSIQLEIAIRMLVQAVALAEVILTTGDPDRMAELALNIQALWGEGTATDAESAAA